MDIGEEVQKDTGYDDFQIVSEISWFLNLLKDGRNIIYQSDFKWLNIKGKNLWGEKTLFIIIRHQFFYKSSLNIVCHFYNLIALFIIIIIIFITIK